METANPFSETSDLQDEPLPGPARSEPPEMPTQIGRFRVERVLGKGGFGVVYLATDEQLNRLVAVKVPHADMVARSEEASAYLAEARNVASLDHPHIVPVYDFGGNEHFPCFVVSKFIDGLDLSARLKIARLLPLEAAELVATVAEALHYAHKTGLVHRDIKPGNILTDSAGRPYVADFGLVLRDEDVGHCVSHHCDHCQPDFDEAIICVDDLIVHGNHWAVELGRINRQDHNDFS
jgi:serine/threonine protein kinase